MSGHKGHTMLRLITLLFLLVPACASAQQQTLPAGTIVGRGLTPAQGGPAEAIPFANFKAAANLVSGPQNCSSSNWFNTLSAAGTLGCAQPNFSDLLGTATNTQINGTSANTPSTTVVRDASGNFAAGSITASLVGGASLDLPLSSLGTGVQAALGIAPNSAGGVVTSPVGASQLPTPGVSTLGGVNSKDCSSGSQFVQKINTDGSITCVTPSGGGNVSNSGTPTAGQMASWISSTQIAGVNYVIVQQVPSTPTGTASTAAAVMMGLGKDQAGSGAHPCTITPATTGRVKFEIVGDQTNNTAGDSVTTFLQFGSGTAPSNAGTLTGTQIGGQHTISQGGSTDIQAPFMLSGYATGLTPGTAYWFDLAVRAGGGGTASAVNISCNAKEE